MEHVPKMVSAQNVLPKSQVDIPKKYKSTFYLLCTSDPFVAGTAGEVGKMNQEDQCFEVHWCQARDIRREDIRSIIEVPQGC